MWHPRIPGLHRIPPRLAIDLGTANTRIFAQGEGLIAETPSEIGPNPDAPLLPLRGGVVVDVDAAAHLLSSLIRRTRWFGQAEPEAIVCAPTDLRQNERSALIGAMCKAGISILSVAPEPLAAALGAGLNIGSSYAQMVIDIGAGVTDIAVIREGRIIHAKAIRLACRDMEAAISDAVGARYGIKLNRTESELLVKKVGAGTQDLLCRAFTR